MKSLFGSLVLCASVIGTNAANADSIRNLPQLSKRVVHHYACRVAHIPSTGESSEQLFEISPKAIGHGSQDIVLKNQGNEIVATANAQMVGVTWSRANRLLTVAQAWVQNSSSKALVLIAIDPEDTDSQVQVNCEAITYAELQAQTQHQAQTQNQNSRLK